MSKEQVNSPSKTRQAISARRPEFGSWIGVVLGFYLLGFGCYAMWQIISQLSSGSHDLAGLYWSVLGLFACWFGTKTIIVSAIYIVLLRQWTARNYRIADSICSRAIMLLSKSPLMGGFDIVYLEDYLGIARMSRGLFESSELLLRSSVARLEKMVEYCKPELRPGVIRLQTVVLVHLSIVCNRQGKYSEAMSLAERSAALLENSRDKQDELLRPLSLVNIAVTNMRLNELDKAEEQMQTVLNAMESLPNPAIIADYRWKESRAGAWLVMSLIRARKSNFSNSTAAFRTFREAVNDDFKRIPPLSTEYLYLLANEFMRGELFEEAEIALDLAYGINRLYPDMEDARQTLNYFEKLLILTKREAEVADMRAWLRPPNCASLVASD